MKLKAMEPALTTYYQFCCYWFWTRSQFFFYCAQHVSIQVYEIFVWNTVTTLFVLFQFITTYHEILNNLAGLHTWINHAHRREERKNHDMNIDVSNALLFNSQDFIGNSPYCLSYNSCDVSLENLELDQPIIP